MRATAASLPAAPNPLLAEGDPAAPTQLRRVDPMAADEEAAGEDQQAPQVVLVERPDPAEQVSVERHPWVRLYPRRPASASTGRWGGRRDCDGSLVHSFPPKRRGDPLGVVRAEVEEVRIALRHQVPHHEDPFAVSKRRGGDGVPPAPQLRARSHRRSIDHIDVIRKRRTRCGEAMRERAYVAQLLPKKTALGPGGQVERSAPKRQEEAPPGLLRTKAYSEAAFRVAPSCLFGVPFNPSTGTANAQAHTPILSLFHALGTVDGC